MKPGLHSHRAPCSSVIMIVMMIIIKVIMMMITAYLLICDALRPEATLEHTAGVVRTGEAETLS